MSKLNSQKASAYVGPGVLRKGGKITPVPNGPLIKKTGKFKGSTLKSGGKVKKAMMGNSIFKDNPIYKKTTEARGMIGNMMGIPGKPIVKNGNRIKKAQDGEVFKKLKKTEDSIYNANKKLSVEKAIEKAGYLDQQRSLKERFNQAKNNRPVHSELNHGKNTAL